MGPSHPFVQLLSSGSSFFQEKFSFLGMGLVGWWPWEVVSFGMNSSFLGMAALGKRCEEERASLVSLTWRRVGGFVPSRLLQIHGDTRMCNYLDEGRGEHLPPQGVDIPQALSIPQRFAQLHLSGSCIACPTPLADQHHTQLHHRQDQSESANLRQLAKPRIACDVFLHRAIFAEALAAK